LLERVANCGRFDGRFFSQPTWQRGSHDHVHLPAIPLQKELVEEMARPKWEDLEGTPWGDEEWSNSSSTFDHLTLFQRARRQRRFLRLPA
jgi:hypothetical protein